MLVISFAKLRVANFDAFMGSSAYALSATSTTCHICRYLTPLYLPVIRFVIYLLFLVHSLCARVRLTLHWGQVWTSSSSLSAQFIVISRFLSASLSIRSIRTHILWHPCTHTTYLLPLKCSSLAMQIRFPIRLPCRPGRRRYCQPNCTALAIRRSPW